MSAAAGVAARGDAAKMAAGEAACDEIVSGMTLGLGTGSTANAFLHALAQRISSGRLGDVRGVPTSVATERLAQRLGIETIALPAHGVDVAVDGMDQVTGSLDAIKGLGGALLREKIVAASAARFILIGDEGKRVDHLGGSVPLPVEVVRFGIARTVERLRDLGVTPSLRGGSDDPFVTDNGHVIVDCRLPERTDPATLAAAVKEIPGVVEHGFFLAMADVAVLAGADGVSRIEVPA